MNKSFIFGAVLLVLLGYLNTSMSLQILRINEDIRQMTEVPMLQTLVTELPKTMTAADPKVEVNLLNQPKLYVTDGKLIIGEVFSQPDTESKIAYTTGMPLQYIPVTSALTTTNLYREIILTVSPDGGSLKMPNRVLVPRELYLERDELTLNGRGVN